MSQNQYLKRRQWIDHMVYEIRNFEKSTVDIGVYRSILSYVYVIFRNISNAFSQQQKTNGHENDQTITSEEAGLFEHAISLIGSLKELFMQQSESKWKNFLLKNPLDTFEKRIMEIILDFMKTMEKLNLGNIQIIWDEKRFKTEAIHDLGTLQQLIENLNSSEYNQKIDDIKRIRNKYASEVGVEIQPKKVQTLEMSEIEESLMSLGKWEIDHDDLEFKNIIGSGGFSEVYFGIQKSTNKKVAIKKLHQQKFDKNTLEMFKSEVAILAKLKHFAILPFIGACTKPPFCIVTEFMPGFSLYSRLHVKEESQKLTPTQLTIIAVGIAFGMNYLHGKQMLHRDLKSLNILLDENNYPKISDFGLAQTKGKRNEDKSNNIGTSQWMAPEVLNSNVFDEKADVYSYGMIIWEMLTGDIPYRGIRDFQVTMTVVNQKIRPQIPKTCPKMLAQFIRNCWNTDPNKRPSFKNIIREFTSETIYFPGTDLAQVRDYIKKYASDTIKAISNDSQDAEITKEQLSNSIAKFKNDPKIIFKLMSIPINDENMSLISQFDIIPTLIENLKSKSISHDIISLHLDFLLKLLSDETMIASFIEHNGYQVLCDLLIQDTSFKYPRILDCLTLSIFSDPFIFTKEHLFKISSFLIDDSSIEVRLKAIKLLNDIIENERYDDSSIFAVVVDNLLQNAVIENDKIIILPILKLLIKIADFEGAKAQLRCIDGPDRILELMKYQDNEILSIALRLLQMLFKGLYPKQRTIAIFLSYFDFIIKANSETQIEALKTLTILMDNELIYKEVSLCKSFPNNFAKFIENNDFKVQLSSLKICFSFCSNQITEKCFQPLLPQFFVLLKETSYSAILSAYCISALLAANDPVETLGDQGEQLKEFLSNVLVLESDLTEPAIRLVGVLSSSISGALLIDKWGIMKNVANLLESRNQNLVNLAIMAITAMSATLPYSDSICELIPLLFTSCNKYANILFCISNLTTDPRNAVKCMEYLPQLFNYLFIPDFVSTVLIIIHRILLNQESVRKIQEEETFNLFVKSIKNLWKSRYSLILYDIIDTLTNYPEICLRMKNIGILECIEEQLNKCSLKDINRPKYIRIRARLLSV